MQPILVGIDTGGTFTDLIAFIDGEVCTHKVPSTPDDPAKAVLGGLRELLPAGRRARITYASTVATNALLERRGARVALITTAGFEDVLEIGRQQRPELYALEPQRPDPLVPRAGRFGVAERMLYDGEVLVPLRADVLVSSLRRVARYHPEAIAVCLLHSYANPRHESQIGRTLAAHGEWFVSLSQQLVPEYREVERMSTTVVNAYVGPVMSRHLRTLRAGLSRHGLRVMQSNGGAIATQVAAKEAVRTLLSGPAAGVIGATSVGRELGLTRLITFDMGGTSTDVSLCDGTPRLRNEWEIGGMPIQVPAIDIHTVGAGGGSIASVDDGGALQVGPRSAGADPGPACYGRGREATVTDANLLLGRLVEGGFLGGRMRLDRARAEGVLRELAQRLGVGVAAAAEGIVRVANAGMERAIRRISVERGHDPREYALVVFGGAGGQHACELAMALGIHHIVVPAHPGLLSAWGAASAPLRRDAVRSLRRLAPDVNELHDCLARLERSARRGVVGERVRVQRSLDVRYVGQGHELTIPFRSRYAATFHAEHRDRFGYADEKRPVEVVNVRVSLVAATRPSPRGARAGRSIPLPARQRVRWQGRWVEVDVRPRSDLPPSIWHRGPSLLCELSATTFVPPGWRFRADPVWRHLEIRHAD